MASARINFTVGLFMTAGLALATVVIIWLGMSSFMHRGEIFVTYFDESVQGLGVDSPVKYRGVPVGRVKNIRIAPDYHLIEVVITIDDEHTGDDSRFAGSEASLASAGITGIMFVEIDKRRPGAPDLSPTLSFKPEYPVIASRPSDIKKFFREIDDIAMKIQSIDFKGISDQVMTAVETFNSTLADARIGAISSDIRTLLASINAAANPKRMETMARNMEGTILASRRFMEQATDDLRRMEGILGQFQSVLADSGPHMNATMSSLASAAAKADGFVTQGQMTMLQMQATIKNLQERLTITAENLENTSAGLNAVINDIQDQPSRIIFSKPRKPRPVEE
ncbi:MAG: MlaD family protein [Pseudomonadota bacterium]|nr:MlaD family protein [Pseudomonadota bacterium]